MKLLLPYLKKYRILIAASLALTAVSTMCEMFLPTVMTDILNNGIYTADLRYILTCCGKMLVIALIGLISVLGVDFFSARLVASMGRDVRWDIYRKSTKLTFEEIGAIGTGGLLSRATHDVATLSWVSSMVAGTAISIPFYFIGGVVMCFRISARISLIMLLSLPVVFCSALIIGRKVEPLWEISDRYIDRQNSVIRERLHGIRVIRAFNREPHEQERAEEATRVMAENIIRSNVSMGFVSPLTIGLMNIAAVLMVYVGASLAEKPQSGITGADVFAVVQYTAMVMNGVLMASYAVIMIPRIKVALRRLAEIKNARGIVEPEFSEKPVFNGEVTFSNVTFSYDGASSPAVTGITLSIPAGTNAAVIGGTGSGKSTLVRLLLGFRKPDSGKILFGSSDISTLTGRNVRECVSCALQKPSVYSGTVRKNLLMGRPDADDEAMWNALRVAQLDDFVRAQPEGLDFVLEQGGKNLSGGQKQRLSIARVLLRDAQIYVFDDSFSALDFLTEGRLRKALNEKYAGKTRITVTQRISTAMASDLIFVMDRGELVDSGSHRELMERCSVYREIYTSQTGGERE